MYLTQDNLGKLLMDAFNNIHEQFHDTMVISDLQTLVVYIEELRSLIGKFEVEQNKKGNIEFDKIKDKNVK